MASAPSAGEATATVVKCDRCKEDFDQEDCVWMNKSLSLSTKRVPIYRCHDCNSIEYRLKTLKCSDPDLVASFRDLSDDKRAQTFDAMRGLIMPDMKKILEESITEKETVAHEESSVQRPTAMPVTQAAKLEMFIDEPEGLQNLLADPKMTFTCEHTQIKMVYIPNYSKANVDIITREKITERSLTGKRTIKSHPKKSGQSSGKKPTATAKLPKAMLKKIESMLADSEANLGILGVKVLQSRTDAGKEFVTAALSDRAEQVGHEVNAGRQELTDIMATIPTAEQKDCIQEILNSLGQKMDAMTEYTTKLEGDPCHREKRVPKPINRSPVQAPLQDVCVRCFGRRSVQ